MTMASTMPARSAQSITASLDIFMHGRYPRPPWPNPSASASAASGSSIPVARGRREALRAESLARAVEVPVERGDLGRREWLAGDVALCRLPR